MGRTKLNKPRRTRSGAQLLREFPGVPVEDVHSDEEAGRIVVQHLSRVDVPSRPPGTEGRFYRMVTLTPEIAALAEGWYQDIQEMVPNITAEVLPDVEGGTPLMAVFDYSQAEHGWITAHVHLHEAPEQRQELSLASIYFCDVEKFSQAMVAA